MNNPLLATDVYKMGHMEQYVPNCTKVYSYLMARNGSHFNETLFFGLQYYLKKYLSIPLTAEMGDELLKYRKIIIGYNSPFVEQQIKNLCKLGYFPVEIKAVEEGTILPVKNALLTITNTIPEFYWVVGFIESLILKVWYPTTVATCCYEYRKAVEQAFKESVDNTQEALKDFMVHDFGYRGDKTEDAAAISGAAHLISFSGSETIIALPFIQKYYNADLDNVYMLSASASEHSVMSSFGRENELDAFRNMLKVYPSGLISIVSDTYDIYRAVTEYATILKNEILERDGKVVFRPDSGDPEYVICGNPHAPLGSNESKGVLKLLEEVFGSYVNKKGYKVLHDKVGIIYGDAMYLDRYKNILARMHKMGFAASNLIIGVGRYLRDFNRDTMGFVIKATYIEVNGKPRLIEKDPITDKNKKSHKGLLSLTKQNNIYTTKDLCSSTEEQEGYLKTVWKNGKLIKEITIDQMRKNVNSSVKIF